MSLRISLTGLSYLVLAGALSACSSTDSNPAGGGAAAAGGNLPDMVGAGTSGATTGGSGAGTAGQTQSGGTASVGGTAGVSAGGAGQSGGGNGSGGTNQSGGSGGMSGGGGTGGMVMTHPGQCLYPPTPNQRKAPEFKLPAPNPTQGLILRLMNNCPQDLWVHANGIPNGVVQLAGRQAGQPPAEEAYDWPGLHGRMSIYEGSDNGFLISFLEMNADPNKAFNVNLSNVDWVGIPVEVRGDDPSKCFTACYQPLANMMNGCPAKLLDQQHHICQAPKNWCANGANVNDPICQGILPAAQAVINNDPKCKGGTVGTPAEVYGCGGFWGSSPYCCAEVARGYKTDTNDTANDHTQNCNYYKQEPYSDYSAWAQNLCPYVYSFAYDDWNDQSGFQSCINAKEMDVTFCPGDP
jgi:hypothetical protein